MSWMQKLSQTYDNCAAVIGLEPASAPQEKDAARTGTLLPIAHTLLRAHITVTLDKDGNLLDAQAQEDTAGTIAPCTEDSESRSGRNPPPHPLFDKLQYLAKDFPNFTGEDTAWFYEEYLRKLKLWCQSPYSHPMVNAVRLYLQKGTLVGDLVEKHVLYTGPDGKLLEKWDGPRADAPSFYKIQNCTFGNVIVRFAILLPGEAESRLWMNENVRQSHIAYTASQQENKRLCYVCGSVVPFIDKHPKKIVSTLANAKLISANDSTGFTYRGRFAKADEAVSIGYETSLKAHNALRWLVQTRGVFFDTKTIVAWGTRNEPVPSPTSDSEALFGADDVSSAADLLLQANGATQRDYSTRFSRAVLSLHHGNLGEHGDVVVMAFDSATVGRLSITYYREMKTGEYIDHIVNWHNTCKWIHSRNRDGKPWQYIGAPSFGDVAFAVYGGKGNDKLKKSAAERLLPCVLDSAAIPADLVGGAVRRASNPAAAEYWDWNKTLSIACALYKKQNEKEGFSLALDEIRTDRSYLYGRLLAVADQIERWALWDAGEKERETNAMRYMNAFSQRPLKTWGVISRNLRPYQARLKGKAAAYNDLITKITDSFLPGQFDKQPEEPLTGAYLLGFHNQRQVFLDARKEARSRRETELLQDMITDDGE